MWFTSSTNRVAVHIAVLCLALASCFCAANAATVVLKPNAQNKSATDVFVKGSSAAKTVKFLTVTDVYRDHYHAAEFHNGHLYIIKRLGKTDASENNPNWADELWRYTKDGKGTKLWAARGIDFRVRADERLVAVLSSHKSDVFRNSLYLLSPDGKLVKSFSPSQLSSEDLDFLKWVDKDLWIKDQLGMEIAGFIVINTQSMAFKKYSVEILASDYDLNTTSKWLAYSDFPVLFDTDDVAAFKARKTPVKLYVYDLQTKQRKLIAESVAEPFNPKWSGSKTLTYDEPKGKGRLQKEIRF